MADSGIVNGLARFDVQLAYFLEKAAALVYMDREAVERRMDEWAIRNFNYFDVDGTQCLVFAGQDSIVVSFRGTERGSVEDWVANADCDLIDGPLNGQVHRGFYEALSNVWRLVDRQVGSFRDAKTRYLWVTGHSLGAALATLAVARWRERGDAVAGLYTFGQPRVGNESFSLNFDFDFKPATFRVVNRYDIVTRVPPRYLGYRHVGTFKYFNDAGELVEDIRWWRAFLKQWYGSVERILDWCAHGVQDHGIATYERRFDDLFRRMGWAIPATLDSNGVTAGRSQVRRRLIDPRRRAA